MSNGNQRERKKTQYKFQTQFIVHLIIKCYLEKKGLFFSALKYIKRFHVYKFSSAIIKYIPYRYSIYSRGSLADYLVSASADNQGNLVIPALQHFNKTDLS